MPVLTRQSIRALHLAWGSIASRFCVGASTTSASCAPPTCGSSISSDMKISREWLQTYFDAPLPEAQVLADALTFHAFEVETVEDDDRRRQALPTVYGRVHQRCPRRSFTRLVAETARSCRTEVHQQCR